MRSEEQIVFTITFFSITESIIRQYLNKIIIIKK